ncbi:OmpA family protein [Desulfuromonas acetexigens]|uniref:OmpA family protein n=1 Tax=Trichloromonas acetexigens TaxID=38815 RepID=A0A550JGF7_9BACT|nr:OmpA family protein [Desulfuromonas acetexigens]TRO82283.1 OmpA family protein [Desulfuromonas acetexigens]
MKGIHGLCIGLSLMIAVSGCAGKDNLIVLTPDDSGQVGALKLSNDGGEAVLDREGQALHLGDRRTSPGAPAPISAEERALFAAALAAQPLAPVSYLLYFEFDSNNLTAESRQRLDDILRAAQERDSQDLLVIGHTDRAGDADYNAALSLQRAEVVRELLASKGIGAEFIQISSHGEGNPLIPTADEVAEARNRRVEVVVR